MSSPSTVYLNDNEVDTLLDAVSLLDQETHSDLVKKITSLCAGSYSCNGLYLAAYPYLFPGSPMHTSPHTSPHPRPSSVASVASMASSVTPLSLAGDHGGFLPFWLIDSPSTVQEPPFRLIDPSPTYDLVAEASPPLSAEASPPLSSSPTLHGSSIPLPSIAGPRPKDCSDGDRVTHEGCNGEEGNGWDSESDNLSDGDQSWTGDHALDEGSHMIGGGIEDSASAARRRCRRRPRRPRSPCPRGGVTFIPQVAQANPRSRARGMGPEGLGRSPSTSAFTTVNNGHPIAEVQPLTSASGHFLLSMSAVAEATLPGRGQNAALMSQPLDVLKNLIHGYDSTTAQLDLEAILCAPAHLQPLVSAAQEVWQTEVTEAQVQLAFYVKVLNFAARVGSLLGQHLPQLSTKQEIFEDLSKYLRKDPAGNSVSLGTLRWWCRDGTVIAQMAGAGSFYLVILMACARVRQDVKNIASDEWCWIARLIRYPSSNSKEGRLVIRTIVPAVSFLRIRYPLFLKATIFGKVLDALGKMDLDCTDLEETDVFFDGFHIHDFQKGRDWVTWAPCRPRVNSSQAPNLYSIDLSCPSLSLQPSATSPNRSLPSNSGEETEDEDEEQEGNSLPPLSKLSWHLPGSITVRTAFKPDQLKYKWKQLSNSERHRYTERQCKGTEKALVPNNLKELKSMLQDQLKSGEKATPDSWIFVDYEKLLEGKPLRIEDVNGHLLVLVLPPPPSHIIDGFLDKLDLAFPGQLKPYTDSRAEGPQHTFPALHACWFFRYAPRGDGAPLDADPASLLKGNKKMNSGQRVPYTSEEWKKNSEEFQRFQEAAFPLFEHIRNMIVEQLPPGTVKRLSQICEVLPCNDASPVYPFSGFVINLNVMTRVHLDSQDDDLCLVFSFSKLFSLPHNSSPWTDNISTGSLNSFDDGALCFQDLGLVVRLPFGGSTAFRSSILTHFNRHFQGHRASLVLHADRHAKGWLEDHHGWDRNIWMSTTTSDSTGL